MTHGTAYWCRSTALCISVVVTLLGVFHYMVGLQPPESSQTEKRDPAPPAASSYARVDGDPTYNAFDTPSIQCRLGMEKFQNDNIESWLKNAPFPMIEWIWKMKDEKTGKPYYLGFFNVLRDKGWTEERANLIMTWEWEWSDEAGNKYSLAPNKVWYTSKYWTRIYFRLDTEGATPRTLTPLKVSGTVPEGVPTPVYDLQPYIKCNQVDQENPPPALKPGHDKKIAACVTNFQGQYDLLPEWIVYNRMIGVDHFFLYVEEPFEEMRQKNMEIFKNEPDITFVPYNHRWEDHSHNVGHVNDIRWSTEDFVEELFHRNWMQVAKNNHCLYQAKQFGLPWVFTPDVEDWMVVQHPYVSHFIQPAPLHQFLNAEHDPAKNQDEAEVCVFGAGYGRHPQQEPDTAAFESTIDFVWRKDRKYGNYVEVADGKGAGGTRKCFYSTKVATGVTVHFKDLESPGTSGWGMEDMMEIYRFAAPLNGPLETKPEELKSYPKFRTQYRSKLMDELNRKHWPLPNLKAHMDNGQGVYGAIHNRLRNRMLRMATGAKTTTV